MSEQHSLNISVKSFWPFKSSQGTTLVLLLLLLLVLLDLFLGGNYWPSLIPALYACVQKRCFNAQLHYEHQLTFLATTEKPAGEATCLILGSGYRRFCHIFELHKSLFYMQSKQTLYRNYNKQLKCYRLNIPITHIVLRKCVSHPPLLQIRPTCHPRQYTGTRQLLAKLLGNGGE